MKQNVYDSILTILNRRNLDIDGLYEFGLPKDFEDTIGISPELFPEFYKIYKKKQNVEEEEKPKENAMEYTINVDGRTYTMSYEDLLRNYITTSSASTTTASAESFHPTYYRFV